MVFCLIKRNRAAGTNPTQLRLRLPHASVDDAIVACIFYSTSNRLDVYYEDAYVMPTNGYEQNGKKDQTFSVTFGFESNYYSSLMVPKWCYQVYVMSVNRKIKLSSKLEWCGIDSMISQ